MLRSISCLLALLIAVAAAGCSPSGVVYTQAQADRINARMDSLERAATLRNPNLNSTLWTQTAVEYDAVTRGAYRLAEIMLQRGLADSTWTASLEQSEDGVDAYRSLPPAVVLDVDETVLDNSSYQARLIRDDASYNSESWKAWCRERAAEPVPGALAFTRAAEAMGAQVIYLTNRDADVEEATRDNLKALGFPVDHEEDVILTQREIPEWAPSNKTPRRRAVASEYRIVLLIGDNFGDFAGEVDTSIAEREEMASAYRVFWGTRWIALPNPQYGSWEGATYDFQYDLPPLKKLDRKHENLEGKTSG